MASMSFVIILGAVWFPYILTYPGLGLGTRLPSPERWHLETRLNNWTCPYGTGRKPTEAQPTSSAISWNRSTTAVNTSAAVPGMAANESVQTSNRKKGFSYNEASYLNSIGGQGASWAYNWKAQPDGLLPPGLEYVPMCWGPGSEATCIQEMQAAITSGSAHLFSFNEPDHQSQANMSPQAAAALHVEVFDSFSTSAKIGSPAVTNGPPPMGISWLEQFLDHCRGRCPIDFVTYHWYDAAQNLDNLRKHTENVINLARRYDISKVWLTEFGAHSGTSADKATFLEGAIEFLDNNPSVERYAYFMLSDGILLEGNRLSNLGEVYIGATSIKASRQLQEA